MPYSTVRKSTHTCMPKRRGAMGVSRAGRTDKQSARISILAQKGSALHNFFFQQNIEQTSSVTSVATVHSAVSENLTIVLENLKGNQRKQASWSPSKRIKNTYIHTQQFFTRASCLLKTDVWKLRKPNCKRCNFMPSSMSDVCYEQGWNVWQSIIILSCYYLGHKPVLSCLVLFIRKALTSMAAPTETKI